MTASREDVRDELRATIAAAAELSEEERDHLADVFLDRLDTEYRLVPRGQPISEPERRPRGYGRGPIGFPFFWPALVAGLGLAAVLWLVTVSVFAVAHPPIFLFVILLFVAFRFWRPRRHFYR